MTDTDKQKWTAGEKVFQPSRGWGGHPGYVRTIDRVTPSGRAVIGSQQYDASGRPIGDRFASNIVPFTDEHQTEIDLWNRQMEAAKLAEAIKWRSLTSEQLDIALPALAALAKAGVS